MGIPFGRVTNVLVLKGKNQAFLEMEEEPSAIAMVNYFTNCVAQLRERSVYVQFSNHTSLKTDQTHSNASASAQAALQVGKLTRHTFLDSTENCPGFRQLKHWQVQERVRLGGRTQFSGEDACLDWTLSFHSAYLDANLRVKPFTPALSGLSWSIWCTRSHLTSSSRSFQELGKS